MKVSRKFKSIYSVAAAVLALSFSPVLGKAQEYHGKFTLPFEAQWGSAVLAPGEYTFEVELAPSHAVLLRGEGGGKAIILPFPMPEQKVSSNQSKLTLVDNGTRYVVRSLEATELGETFEYPVAKAKTKQMARGGGLMWHVPVSQTAP